MLKRIIHLLLLLLLLSTENVFANEYYFQKEKTILYINSYHEGYKWSDDILVGIQSQFFSHEHIINIDVEYMDTKRISSNEYLEKLKFVYEYKFKNKNYDLIIVSDNAAFNLINEIGETLFKGVPIVFCGVNNFDEKLIRNRDMITGVVETYEIQKTIELALQQNPLLNNIYYINDNTVTGQAIQEDFNSAIQPYQKEINFTQLEGSNLDEITKLVKEIPENSIILLLVFFTDTEGNVYEYYESIEKIEKYSNVPIYSIWDFYLGHGIIGGMLTSGYYQGYTAASLGIDILNGETPGNIPITKFKTNEYKFDYVQLEKFNLPIENLPQESIIINHESKDKIKILILNSYNKGLKWTDDIESGISQALKVKENQIEFNFEYMNVNNITDPIILYRTKEFLNIKYQNSQFDLVITTDDDAFKFIQKNYQNLFKDIPIVFCGVNYFDSSMKQLNMTGVVQNSEIFNTIDIALKLHPTTKRIVIINDNTLTGRNNQKNLDQVIPYFSDRISFEYWSDINMSSIEENLKKLNNEDLILLLSFTRDKSYNNFSYEESIRLISKNSPVPIYGLWDFYLGEGLIGGMLISGIDEGLNAGSLVLQILNGESPEEIPVINSTQSSYMFDYEMLTKFNVDISKLPPDSVIINKPLSIKELYNNNEIAFNIVMILIAIIFILFIIIYLLIKNNRIRKNAQIIAQKFATTDALTGAYNRRAFFEFLNIFCNSNDETPIISIAFIDIDNLKEINDSNGHFEGDELLKIVSQLIQLNIRESDKLCRMGGDEFIIIFKNSLLNHSKIVWERIQEKIDIFNKNGTKPYLIKLSIGFAQFDPNKHRNFDDFIMEADKEMYKNKMDRKDTSDI